MADPNLRALTSLGRLRHVETDGARRDLGDALAKETALAARDEAIEREMDAARWVSGNFDREAFSAWFGRMQTERVLLADAMRDAKALTAAARTALAHRRVAETSAEEELARQVSAREVELERRDQLTLEDVARALKLGRLST